MRFVVVAGLVLAGCFPNEAIRLATRPTVDAYCASALAHLKECDPRFPDRIALCDYGGGGECAPSINAEQSQCLRESSCEAVHTALEKRDWLCGLSLAVPIP
jgi:hypothetical protein